MQSNVARTVKSLKQLLLKLVQRVLDHLFVTHSKKLLSLLTILGIQLLSDHLSPWVAQVPVSPIPLTIYAGSLALDLAAAPFAAVGNAVTGAAKKTDEWLSNVVSKERSNRAQKATDMSVEDIKRAMNVRRLIGTDPVLKDADPRAVLEIYNTIAARNPDIAGDMASLRLVLREAVSYEGLTLDSQKLLTEIRRNSEQGAKESDENSRRRYAVGGANPLAIASKALQT